MRLSIIALISFVATLTGFAAPATAFCGFYVARADGELYNEASKVVIARNGRRSVITMSSDYRGAANEFAMIVPTPRVLRRDQVKTVKPETVDHLDAYTAPRLVEYFDHDPCQPQLFAAPVMEESASIFSNRSAPDRNRGARALGVTIKAEYAVGIYDIAILKAKQSDGLITFLRNDGYTIPDGADQALQSYIKDGMKFFVARVNLSRHQVGKSQDLPPLQISFRSDKFMLPIQLGKINSAGSQDMLLYTLTKNGRVDLANYDVERIPTGTSVPVFVEHFFGEFYTDMFNRLAPKSGAILEYAWDMAWCDPCAADPLSKAELKELGVNWLKIADKNAGQDVFVTRLHLRYGKNSFRQDLILSETDDRENFQGRYVMNHPYDGEITCKAGREYVQNTRKRLAQEAHDLHQLTGWQRGIINRNIARSVPAIYH
ncbi:MAG: DUF2330 domain-containing protein [Paracoccaceae bacterium]